MSERTASRAPTESSVAEPGAPRRALAAARALPFTAAGTLVLLVVALGTGALWSPTHGRRWFADLAYGLPAFAEGRWWTPATGALFGGTPVSTVLGLVAFMVLVGVAERQLGTRRAALAMVAGHLGAVALAAALLLACGGAGSGWAWAARVSTELGAGSASGSVAAFAVATAVFRSPWRLRARATMVVWVLAGFVLVGGLAETQHLVATAFALPLGGWLLARSRPGAGAPATMPAPREPADLDGPGDPEPVELGRHTAGSAAAGSAAAGSATAGSATAGGDTAGGGLRARASRREWRLLAVAGVVFLAVAGVLLWLRPRDNGPLGPTGEDNLPALDVALTLLVAALLIGGLRKGSRVAWRWAVALAALNVGLGVLVAVLVAVAVTFDLPYELDGVPFFVAGRLAWAALLGVLLVGRGAFAVPSRRRARAGRAAAAASGPDRAALVEVLRREGGGTLSWMATWPGNSYFGTSTGGVVTYQAHAGMAIALGDPIGPVGSAAGAMAEWAEMCDRARLAPCAFSVTAATVAAAGPGWRSVQVAEDTLVDLPGLEFKGKPWQAVRSAMNKAGREGITFRLVNLAEERLAVVERVRGISEEWVGDKGLPEMGFTLGGVDEALDPAVRVGLATDAEGRVHGVTSWLPVYGHGGRVRGWTLDLMRRRHDGFRGVMEFLIASSCVAFREQGAEVVSLSGAPLARAEGAGPDEVAGLERALETLGAVMEPLYGFRSLHAFKAKFSPRYEPMFLLYRDAADLPRVGAGLTRAYLPGVSVRELIALGVRP